MSDTGAAGVIRQRLQESAAITTALVDAPCVAVAAEVAERMASALRAGHKVIFFGNGGSSMDAGHLAAELVGRLHYDRPSLPALSLPDSTASMTAIGNDYSYDEVFARQVRALAAAGDVVVGLSTSGMSANVVKALQAGRERGAVTVALTGAGGGAVAEVAELCVRVPTTDTPRVQEACMHLGHSICEYVEAELFPRDHAGH